MIGMLQKFILKKITLKFNIVKVNIMIRKLLLFILKNVTSSFNIVKVIMMLLLFIFKKILC